MMKWTLVFESRRAKWKPIKRDSKQMVAPLAAREQRSKWRGVEDGGVRI